MGKSRDELERKTDINSANADELSALTGIGDALSQGIIDYRNANGPFESVDEIKSVDGIDEIIFEKIKDKICVSGSNAHKSGAALTEPISALTTSAAADKPISTDISFPLELNTCTLEELRQIPDLPEDVARQIIDLRTKIKKFSRIEEILMVDSIDRELYNIICKYVYIKE